MSPEHAVEQAADQAARRRSGVVVSASREGVTATAARSRDAILHEQSLFEIGSITKTFTCLVLANAVVRGDLELDQPVRELLPDGVAVPRRDGVEITLRQLATHTSGLPRNPLRGVTPWWDSLRSRDPFARITPDRLLEVLETTKLKRTPGHGRPAYSNFGAALLGEALVRWSGAPDYYALVADRVCTPLGLSNTGSGADEHRVEQGHRGRYKPVSRWHLTGLAGAGGLVSCASDLLRYLQAQMDPDSTLLGEAIRLTQTEHAHQIGLGWMRNPKPHLLLWHNGGTGGFRSFAGFVPQERTAVVVLSNHARFVDLTALRLLRTLTEDSA